MTGTSSPAHPDGPRQRLLASLALVVSWIVLGLLLDLPEPVEYLLIGVPLAIVFQLAVRRRPLRELWARSGARRGRARLERATIAALVVMMIASYIWLYPPERPAAAANTIWATGIFTVLFAGGYLALRRAVLAFAVALLLVCGLLWAMAPRPAGQRSGDPQLLAQMSMFGGYRDLSVAVVDLDAARPVRFANIGSTNATRFEIGSISKALTGLVIADAVERGEVDMATPVSEYYPPLAGSTAGAVTLQQLVTHSSGYPAQGAATDRRAYWRWPLGLNWIDTDLDGLTREARTAHLSGGNHYAYSNLGAATAGQVTARAAHLSYPELMRSRLFTPLGMRDTTIQTTPTVKPGESAIGRQIQPWTMRGYAPAGAVVSSSRDLVVLATALLDAKAPGMAALAPTSATDQANTRIGTFWHVSRWQNGQTITWHNGGSGGYTSYLGLDRQHRKAVIVLSDVDQSVDDLGIDLLAGRLLTG